MNFIKKMRVFIFMLLFTVPVLVFSQNCDKIDSKKLKEILIGMGYTVSDIITTPGKEKFEIKTTTPSFNIPIAYEISPSGNFIWLTVSLGKPKTDSLTQAYNLLKQNGAVQPCQFYLTSKGNLMLGLALENRGITPAIIKRNTDKVTQDVSNTSTYWQ